jgi:hypothetical protein
MYVCKCIFFQYDCHVVETLIPRYKFLRWDPRLLHKQKCMYIEACVYVYMHVCLLRSERYSFRLPDYM